MEPARRFEIVKVTDTPARAFREKLETFFSAPRCRSDNIAESGAQMAQGTAIGTAVDTDWTIYRATQGVGKSDCRLYLLERHLIGRAEARESEVEELASLGVAHLATPPEAKC